MTAFDLRRRLAAEAVGTALLVATVVGSGIMAERLAGGNVALALLGNTVPTGAVLVVLITVLAPISGAHLNPAVTLAFTALRQFPRADVLPFLGAQLAGGIAGTALAHLMFDHPLLELGLQARSGIGKWTGELIATFGLVTTILLCARLRPGAVPSCVALWIVAAYWFTSSTSFANPAVTIARSLTTTFAGIAPGDVPAFVLAELAGAALAVPVAMWLFAPPRERAVSELRQT